MIDISLCANKDCPKKNDCVRYRLKSNSSWQSMFIGDYKDCDLFIRAEDYPEHMLKPIL